MRASFISDRQCGQIGSWNAGTMLSLNQQVGVQNSRSPLDAYRGRRRWKLWTQWNGFLVKSVPVPDILKHSARKARDAQEHQGRRRPLPQAAYMPLGDSRSSAERPYGRGLPMCSPEPPNESASSLRTPERHHARNGRGTEMPGYLTHRANGCPQHRTAS